MYFTRSPHLCLGSPKVELGKQEIFLSDVTEHGSRSGSVLFAFKETFLRNENDK